MSIGSDAASVNPTDPGAETSNLMLRPSSTLARVPAVRPPAPPAEVPPAEAPPASSRVPSLPDWALGAAAVVAGLGWLLERRQRRMLETEKDSVFWANVQPPGSSIITTAGSLDDILPDSPNPAEKARAIYVTEIGETNSRREATLIDLHQLQGKLERRKKRGNHVDAILLLQQHLIEFRYSSPWVFLELRELYLMLERQGEWEVAREAFKHRFGQNAPAWAAPSGADASLADDLQLRKEVVAQWPYREARLFILRWMLGEPDMRQKCSGPPLLPLGVYRDLMLLDSVLDDVMEVHTRVMEDSVL